jgi:hypothetical protein
LVNVKRPDIAFKLRGRNCLLRPGVKYLVWNIKGNADKLNSEDDLLSDCKFFHTQLLLLPVKPSMLVHSILGLYIVSPRVIPIPTNSIY